MESKQKIKSLDDLIYMLKSLESEIFEEKGYAYFNGNKYLRSDWRTYIAVLENIRGTMKNQYLASCKYIKKNPEYNRIHRMLSYYSNKKHKTPNDYKQIEKIQKQLKNYLEKRDRKKDKMKKIEQEIEENRRKYDNDERGI